MAQQGIIIAGAGAAGMSAVASLRAEGYEGPLTVINGEPHLPYNRTLVNKGVLPGLLTVEQITQPGARALEGDLVQGRAASLDTENFLLTLEDGRALPYTALIAATGSAPRPDSRITAAPERVFHLHTAQDAVRLRAQLGASADTKTITILGAGFIGAETASYLADAGARVNLVARSATPLAAALGSHIAQQIGELHRLNVTSHFGQDITALIPGPASVTATLSDGQILESDLVVIAHGNAPSSAWITGDDNGIAVDSHLRVRGFERLYAAGSVALHPASDGQLYGIDHWDAAAAQGAHAARAVLHDITGAPDPGPYTPDTGYTLTVYRQSAAAYGTVLPGSHETQHDTGTPKSALSSFHRPDGTMIAVAGLNAFPQLLAARNQLTTP
ncbi:3-phenylpropionate/trans-cinnamate dioxygenase ferredoxin reductase subunit [Arthrobacter sp. V4I6]|uniref:FAD-dependent oxidoreductase n=1 Tax=unclassified Arthrobacter TaxID=235627 RepID=UPI0027858084|nr:MULTISPECIES: FAD/NAD(P)-binding oxidoreductase [unclassified Arthrobacter]MDQ0823328.1 3-phenylpropionate/trans-cinnamate dioxygenase ferredoxin reductase subunit [Arthrobacter sp. V1I7]MDQ0852962.1 3-phenylpropionate/trans-cinnamate dioxygenase ferredoxin reductase subunit [Arthrobacter sp. V4I6]